MPQNISNITKPIYKWNKWFDSIVNWLAFTVYNAIHCSAVCSQFLFMSFYIFLLSLVPVKNQNPALQRKRTIWRAFQMSKAQRHTQRNIEFSVWMTLYFISEMNCRAPSIHSVLAGWLIRNPMIWSFRYKLLLTYRIFYLYRCRAQCTVHNNTHHCYLLRIEVNFHIFIWKR